MLVFFAAMSSLLLSACSQQAETTAPEARPVRTVTVERREAGVPITMTGRIESDDEVALSFRIGGRIFESGLNVGDPVKPGQVIARLESQNERNGLRAAQAGLAAAQAQLTQARNHYERQETLMAQGWTTRANYDHAKKGLQTAQSQVEAAEAQLKSAHDLVGFTEIIGDSTASSPRSARVREKLCKPVR
jgi:RND family efflux transporter MFP subunit